MLWHYGPLLFHFGEISFQNCNKNNKVKPRELVRFEAASVLSLCSAASAYFETPVFWADFPMEADVNSEQVLCSFPPPCSPLTMFRIDRLQLIRLSQFFTSHSAADHIALCLLT